MTIKTEPMHTGEFVVSEANGARSRKEAVLASGNLAAGAVLAVNTDGDYVALAPAATDGTEVAKAVLYSATDASGGAAKCVVFVRDCEVADEALTWPGSITTEQKATAIANLESAGIIVR